MGRGPGSVFEPRASEATRVLSPRRLHGNTDPYTHITNLLYYLNVRHLTNLLHYLNIRHLTNLQYKYGICSPIGRGHGHAGPRVALPRHAEQRGRQQRLEKYDR